MDEVLKLLAGSGAMGVVVWMLLVRINPKLDEIASGLYKRMLALEAAHDRNATATSLRIIATPNIIPAIKDCASEVIEAAKLAESERSKP